MNRPRPPVVAVLLLAGAAASLPSRAPSATGVHGRVVAGATPPDSVSVTLRPLGDGHVALGSPRPLAVSPDARFTVPAEMLPGLVEVTAPGFRRELRWLATEGPPELGIVLEPVKSGEPPEPEARTARVEVRVVDDGGDAVPGATVRVTRLDLRRLATSPVPFEVGPGTVTATAAGPDGTLTFRLPGRIERPEADTAGLLVTCEAPGRATGVAAIRPLPAQEVTCRTAADPVSVSGRVVEAGGTSVAGVPMTILAPTEGGPLVAAASSGEDGRFDTGAKLPPAPEYWVVVNVPPYEPVAERVPWPPAPVELTVRRGLTLDVEVVDAQDGRPIAGAAVSARISRQPLVLERPAEALSGSYRLSGLPAGTLVELAVSEPHHLPLRRTVMLGPDRTGGAAERVELEPAGFIAGTVRAARGAPVAGARVVATGTSRGTSGASAVTDEEGRFLLGGLVAGEAYRLSCEAAGYAPWWRDEVRATRPGTRLEVVLARGATVRGMVLHTTGTPAAGVVVRALRVTQDPEDPNHFHATPEAQREARTGEDGRYVLYGLAPGDYLIGPMVDTLASVGNPLRTEPPPPLPLADGDLLRGLDFVLADLGRLRVDVRDLPPEVEGEPRVTFYRRAGREPFVGRRETVVPRVRDGGATLEVEGIAPATYDVEVRFPGYLPERFPAVRVRGNDEAGLEIDGLRRGAEVRVRVVDDRGAPLPGVLVRLFRVTGNELAGRPGRDLGAVPEDSPSLQRGLTGADGEAVFPGVEPGEHQVHVTRGEGPFYQGPYTVDTVEVPEADLDRPVELVEVLREGMVVPFVLLDRAGEPLAGATLNVSRVVEGYSGIRSSGVADAQGVARVPHLVPGLHDVEVFASAALEEGRVSQLVYRVRVVVDGTRPVTITVP